MTGSVGSPSCAVYCEGPRDTRSSFSDKKEDFDIPNNKIIRNNIMESSAMDGINGKSAHGSESNGSHSSLHQTNDSQATDQIITNGLKHMEISNPRLDINNDSTPPPQQPSHPYPIPPTSGDYGIRRRTRTSEDSKLQSSLSTPSPPGMFSRKSADIPMNRELASSGSPPVQSYMRGGIERRTSRNNLRVETSPHMSIDGSTSSPTRYNLRSGAYQQTSRSAGNLLSRPTTPTLPQSEGSPRSGSPENLLPRSASDQTPKKKTIDDFTIGRVLGEGSYGAVVEAIDKETGIQYAIKILEKKHILRENKVKYVTTERDILGQCYHPGIVKLFYTFRSEANYVLELCPHEFLGQIKHYSGLDEECVRFYTAEIIEALEYLHGKGVVHRDLKPENILLSADYHIKLCDFGTAKILGTERNARSNSFVGTAEYVSPELIGTRETSCASDLWSLGSIVYQMCANRLPFKGKTDFLTFNKVTSRDLAFPINFPPDAKDLVENLLALKPEERIGAREGGFEELKKHKFFTGINWGQLREQKPPVLKKPLMPVIFEELSPPPSPTHNNLLRTSSTNVLLHSNSPTSSPRMRANSETAKWTKFLNADESIRYMGLVWKRKGLSIKKRHLMLTNYPRLLYVDPKKMELRGEIPWSEHLRPELKSQSNFNIHTPKRKYILEDTTGNATKWVEQIQLAIANFRSNDV